MKKIILIALSINLLMISCAKTKEERIRENIEAKLKPLMKDPDSYKFVSMKIKKTFSVAERRKTVNDKYLKEVQDLNKTLPVPELLFQAETEYNFLKKQTDENKDATYYVDFVAKGTNSFGATIQSKYTATVVNDDSLTVVRLKRKN